jgi:hypothetical protein
MLEQKVPIDLKKRHASILLRYSEISWTKLEIWPRLLITTENIYFLIHQCS